MYYKDKLSTCITNIKLNSNMIVLLIEVKQPADKNGILYE